MNLPTTALDVTIQAQVLEVMRDMAKAYGTALVMITHNLGVVARYAERVIVMYAGKIIESGTAKEIYNNPQHPYTIGLLKSVPRLDENTRAKLDPIEGLPPDVSKPRLCQFCNSPEPVLVEVNKGHWSAKCSEDDKCAGWFPRFFTDIEQK